MRNRKKNRKKRKRKTGFRINVHRRGMETLNEHKRVKISRRSVKKQPPVKIERKEPSWVWAMMTMFIRGQRKK